MEWSDTKNYRQVPIYLRVADQPEIRIGTARQLRDVPNFLRVLADRLERGMSADELESPTYSTPCLFD